MLGRGVIGWGLLLLLIFSGLLVSCGWDMLGVSVGGGCRWGWMLNGGWGEEVRVFLGCGFLWVWVGVGVLRVGYGVGG